MTVTAERAAAPERSAARRSDRDSGRPRAVEQLTPPGPVAREEDARASVGPAGPARPAEPANRQMVLYGVAAYALARLPFDRRFQANVITLALGLVAAKSILGEGAKGMAVGVERYYLHVEPGSIHLPRRGRRRRTAR